MRWHLLQRASTITFTLGTVKMCTVRLRHNISMQLTALPAAADAERWTY
jgi:hypothetical protein